MTGSTPNRACAGPCNARQREQRAQYRTAVAAYQEALDSWEIARAKAREADDQAPADVGAQRPRPPSEPSITWTLGDPVWCARCAATIKKALAELDDLAALLESWADGRRDGTTGERAPVRCADCGSPSLISDTLRELDNELARLETSWRAFRRLPRRPDGDRPRTVTWLVDQLDAVLAQPGSAPFGESVLRWHARLQTMTGTDPQEHGLPARLCPRCRHRTSRTRQSGHVECGNPYLP